MKRFLFLLFWINPIISHCQDPRPYVLLVALERIDHRKHGNKYSDAATAGAKSDVDNIRYMLHKSNFQDEHISVLFNEQATRQRVLDSLKSMARKAKNSNDLIIFYFTGHGDRKTDRNGDEADQKDEALVCYDELLIDDDLNKIWIGINPSVRILMIVDACHSGTTYKMLDHKINAFSANKHNKFQTEILFEKSALNISENGQSYSDSEEPYQMIYMSAAKDPDTAVGGISSEFTSSLLSVFNLYQNRKTEWEELTYKKYWAEVAASVSGQKIVYAEVGKCKEILKDYPYKIKNP